MFNRGEFKTAAKSKLKGKWGVMVGIYLICMLLIVAEVFLSFESSFVYLIGIFISGPFTLSIAKIALNISTLDKSPKISHLAYGFKYVLKATAIYVLINFLYIIYNSLNLDSNIVWSLINIVSTIIFLIFGQAIYVLAENPEVSLVDTLRESYNLTKGHRWNIFVLQLSFLGLVLLSILTLGIGLLWLLPYMEVTMAELYIYLKGEKLNKELN